MQIIRIMAVIVATLVPSSFGACQFKFPPLMQGDVFLYENYKGDAKYTTGHFAVDCTYNIFKITPLEHKKSDTVYRLVRLGDDPWLYTRFTNSTCIFNIYSGVQIPACVPDTLVKIPNEETDVYYQKNTKTKFGIAYVVNRNTSEPESISYWTAFGNKFAVQMNFSNIGHLNDTGVLYPGVKDCVYEPYGLL